MVPVYLTSQGELEAGSTIAFAPLTIAAVQLLSCPCLSRSRSSMMQICKTWAEEGVACFWSGNLGMSARVSVEKLSRFRSTSANRTQESERRIYPQKCRYGLSLFKFSLQARLSFPLRAFNDVVQVQQS